jgi:hypothetical protein
MKALAAFVFFVARLISAVAVFFVVLKIAFHDS